MKLLNKSQPSARAPSLSLLSRLLVATALVVTALAVLGSDSPQLFAQSASVDSSDEDRSISRVLFGSCIKQDLPMPILRTMLAEPANLVIFLGDNIYADTLDMQVMRAKYDLLGRNEDFVWLRSK